MRQAIMIHRLSRWYFIFGHSPNTTGSPHVGIRCLPTCTCYLLPVNGLSLSPSSFVPPSFSFHCLFIISFFACIVFRLSNYYSFSISRSSVLFLHLSLFHLGFITNPWYNSFGRRCFSYRAPDVLCNWQVMFFDFTHQELFFLLIGKPLRNPATMAGFSDTKTGPWQGHDPGSEKRMRHPPASRTSQANRGSISVSPSGFR